MSRKQRRFVDAPQDKRCQAHIILKDKTAAQCGRYAKKDGLCVQHYKLGEVTR